MKKIILIIIAVTFSMLELHAEKMPKDTLGFKLIKRINSDNVEDTNAIELAYDFYGRNILFTESHIYGLNWSREWIDVSTVTIGRRKAAMVVIDKDYNVKVHKHPSKFDTVPVNNWVDIKKWKDDIYWIMNNVGFLVLKTGNGVTPPEILHAYSAGYYEPDNVKGFPVLPYPYPEGPPIGGMKNDACHSFCFDRKGEYVYFLGYCNSLKCNGFFKMRTDNPDTVEYIKEVPGTYFFQRVNTMLIDSNDIIWIAPNVTDGSGYPFLRFDTKTGEFLPSPYEGTNIELCDGTVLVNYAVNDMLILPQKYEYKKVLVANKKNVYSYYNKDDRIQKILIGDMGCWDTIPIPFHLILVGAPDDWGEVEGDRDSEFSSISQWTEDEIAIWCEKGRDNRLRFIYNFETKEWRTFDFPLVNWYGFPTRVRSITNAVWQGKRHFFAIEQQTITPSTYLYVYDPDNVGIEDEVESKIIPDLWIRNITPNPATNQATVNIMYYPSGIYSNDLEVGLYNYMGEKIIDLTPLGIYKEHNHTWEATFDIPKRLASGMYFLNVRSGDESRTKGIAIY